MSQVASHHLPWLHLPEVLLTKAHLSAVASYKQQQRCRNMGCTPSRNQGGQLEHASVQAEEKQARSSWLARLPSQCAHPASSKKPILLPPASSSRVPQRPIFIPTTPHPSLQLLHTRCPIPPFTAYIPDVAPIAGR